MGTIVSRAVANNYDASNLLIAASLKSTSSISEKGI